MAKIVDILETDRDRKTAEDFNVVHMYKTGQFYTAYDWSAWIISVISYTDAVRNQTRDRHPLTVTRIKMATGDTTFCKVGFPFKSIEKFCPLRQGFEGVEFLGSFVKPYRDYISNKTLERIINNIQTMDLRDVRHVEASINSYLGVLSHSSTYNIKRTLFEEVDGDSFRLSKP